MKEGLEGRFREVPTDDLAKRPSDGGWSAAEALRHVHRANVLYLDRIEQRLSEGAGKPGPTYRPGLLGGPFARSQGPEKTRKFKTTRVFIPTETDPGAETVVADLLRQQERLASAVDRAGAGDLTIRVISPATSLLRFRIGDALLLLSRHQLRHLAQARRALGDILD